MSSSTHESFGLSDVNEWRRILTHFGQQSVANSKTITKIAKNLLATEEFKPELMVPYDACRLIPLDKNPGKTLIGIQVMRRIIGRTFAKCLKNELMSLGSNY